MSDHALRDTLLNRYNSLMKEAGGLLEIAVVADISLYEQMKNNAISILGINQNSSKSDKKDAEGSEISRELEEFLLTLLADSDVPMSLEQIFQVIDAQPYLQIKRASLAVRLHRLASPPLSKITNPSRGHYWINEIERARHRRSM